MEIFHHPLNIQYYPKKIIAETRKTGNYLIKPVSLEYSCEKDYIYYLQRGLAYMRQARLLRITTQTYLQSAFLSYPDLVLLLTTSISTLKRDVKAIQDQGILVPLGRVLKDVGATGRSPLLYPARALDLYFEGVPLSSVLEKTYMTEAEFQEVLEDFHAAYKTWETDGLGDQFHKNQGRGGVIPPAAGPLQDIAPILLEHFYRVYQCHRGKELMIRQEKCIFNLDERSLGGRI